MTPNLPKQPPEAIAEDVMRAAHALMNERFGGNVVWSGPLFEAIARAIMAERQRCEAEWATKLADPNAVHVNMLRGTIAKPSIDQIVHLYGGEVTRAFYRAGA